MSLSSYLAPLLAGSVGAFAAAAKSFTLVHEGELGIKLRFGKAVRDCNGQPKVMSPGWRLLIPFADKIKSGTSVNKRSG